MDISSAIAQVAPDLLKALTILPDTTVRRTAVDQEYQNHTGNWKKDNISLGHKEAYYLQVFQRLY